MALFSWFNSSDQVDTILVYVAVVGAVIELGVALAAVINVHKEIEESRKKKLEKYIEVFACVAAFFFLAEAILGWRSSMLLAKEVEGLRAANLALEARIQPRRITPEQKATIRRDLSKWRFIGDKCQVHITVEPYDTEARIFAEQISDLLGENFKVLTDESMNVSPPRGFGTKLSAHAPLPSGARAIARSLQILPINPISVEISTNIQDGTLFIEVYPKPLE